MLCYAIMQSNIQNVFHRLSEGQDKYLKVYHCISLWSCVTWSCVTPVVITESCQ